MPNETKREKENLLEKNVSRRDILKSAGIGGLGVLIGASGLGGVMAAADRLDTFKARGKSELTIPFYGKHQAGIATPKQDHLYFAALDVTTESRQELKELFKEWTAAAADMTAGALIGKPQENGYIPPADTGEAAGLEQARLTITFGVGPTLFNKAGTDRFGLGGRQPKELKKLPVFQLDALDEAWSEGDLCIQVCSDDAQVNFHAVRNLVRIARGKAVLRWGQEGFQGKGRPKADRETPRNLFGFKDETVNLSMDRAKEFNENVWVQSGDGPAWMTGGSYLVVRKIQMHIEVWDRTTLNAQEGTFGRHRATGAPLGKKDEFAPLSLDRQDAAGTPVIPQTAHVRLAHGEGAEKLLRRSYSYSNGMSVNTGTFDAGLLFMCYQRKPSRQFIPVQKRLAKSDKLNEYITHRGSAIFACLPGAHKGSWIGEALFR